MVHKSQDVGGDKQKYIAIFECKSDSIQILEHNFTGDKICMIVEGKYEDLTRVMRGVNGSFAKYYNRRYIRQGRVFKQRYKSIQIESKDIYQFYSNYLSEISGKIQKPTNLYDDILAYAIENYISVASIFNPTNREDKVMRQKLIKKLLISNQYTISNITKALKMSKSTIFRIIKCIK